MPKTKGNFTHNPSISRSPDGQIWLSLRANTVQLRKNLGLIGDHAPAHYQNHLYIGKLNEDTLKITDLKEVTPVPHPIFYWGIEDVRLFHRPDGLHGIGVTVDTSSGRQTVCQTEILIDHATAKYRLLRTYGNPRKLPEKNWSPPTDPTPQFDFAYSPTEVVKDGRIIGTPYDGRIHGGTQLLPYKDGYLTIAHTVMRIDSNKHYISQALLRNQAGITTHLSQLFHLDVGWRSHLKESVEFISGAVWSGKDILVTLGVKDVLCGAARIPLDKLEFTPFEEIIYYNTKFAQPIKKDSEPIESLLSSGKL